MKKLYIAIIFVFLATGLMNAQVPDWQWLLHIGSGSNDYGYAVCTDQDDYIYQAGGFGGSVVI